MSGVSNYLGKVTSLMMIENEMGNRGTNLNGWNWEKRNEYMDFFVKIFN
jgi:hypothetical protein